MDAARRWFITQVPLAVLAAPVAAQTQRPTKTPTVGVVWSGTKAEPLVDLFRQGLREQGQVEGQTIAVEARSVDGDPDGIPYALAELLRKPVDLLVVMNNDMAQWAKAATKTVPIVIIAAYDAVGAGLVASISRPGGNITGNESVAPELETKRIELLKEIVPAMARIAAIYNPGDPGMPSHLRHTEAAAARVGARVRRVEARTLPHLKEALAQLAQDRPDALLPFGDTLVATQMSAVIEFAASQRVPALYEVAAFARMGGLIAYGPNRPELIKRAAAYVDQIVKGARPGALPMQLPTKLDLVVNMKTAGALGITMPPALVSRASEVIE
jgi:putative ABC transport system substrate-binding protein